MTEAASATEHPLNPLCKRWLEVIGLAQEFKQSNFQRDADEAMKFFECGKELNDLMWSRGQQHQSPHDEDEGGMPAPRFRVVVGKVAELVELFGPTLYHRNPDIVVESKTLEIPNEMLFPLIDPQTVQQAQMMAQQNNQPFDMNSLIPPDPDKNKNDIVAKLMAYFLNYIQRENDKKTQSRRAIDEALIKGMGILWTQSYTEFPGGPDMIGSFYDTVDNLVIDPDSETIDECWWIARKRIQPYWEVAEKFDISPEYLKEKYASKWESANSQAARGDSAGDSRKRDGKTNDLIEYYEIYSKMGFGYKLKETNTDREDPDQDAVMDQVEKFGDNVYLAIAKEVPFPLNFHTDHLHELMTEPDEEVLDQMHEKRLLGVSWPIPFWADGMWPFTPIAFHEVPNNPWPMSHIKPGLAYLKFINWVMSFLLNKIGISARSVAATFKACGAEVTEKLFSGKDFALIELAENLGAGSDINKLVSFLDMPQVNPDIWKIIDAVFSLFDKATGLTEIMYGSPGGMRSAAEAQMKSANASVRSDDMANKVEDALSLVARKEAMAARWLLDQESVGPILGKRGASLWQQFVATKDLESVAREFNYRVEAGSARKPNKESQAQLVQQAMQVMPPMFQAATNPQFYKAVDFLLGKWAEANNYELPQHLIPAPVPQPNPMQQKIEAEIQGDQQRLQMEMQGKQQELGMKQQGQQSDLQMKREKNAMDLQIAQEKMALERQKAGLDMQVKQAEASQEMQLGQQKAQAEVSLAKMDMLANIATKGIESRQSEAEHSQSLQHNQQTHQQGLQHAEQQAKLARQQAKQKPKPGAKK